MQLQVCYIKRKDFTYINVSDVKEIINFNNPNEKFVIISKKEIERLKAEIKYLKKNSTLF